MTDVFDKKTRSENMSRIRGKDTKPELLIRKELHRRGFRYSLHRTDLPGKPDIILPKFNAVIQIHGCFWHGHTCHLFRWPKTRKEFWHNKINQNVNRDIKNKQKLNDHGWRILIIWECAIKGKYSLEREKLLDLIVSWLNSAEISLEIAGSRLLCKKVN